MNIHESLESILGSGTEFGSTFYDNFFERCPKAVEYFEGIDMNRQRLVLTMALKLLEQYYTNRFLSIEQYLHTMGTRHNDHRVPRDMYPEWKDAMLVTLEGFHGDQWNDDLAREWTEAIELATDVMFRGYDKRARV